MDVQSRLLEQGHLAHPLLHFRIYELRLMHQGRSLKSLQVLLLSQKVAVGGPLILFLNKCGNHTLLKSPKIKSQDINGQHTLCPGPMNARGWREKYWAVQTALEEGFTLLTFHETSIAPDHPQLFQKALNTWPKEFLSQTQTPGLIAQWAWGLQHVARFAKQELAYSPVGLFGHSRRGKAALLATSQSKDVDFVVGHQTGTLGAVPVQDFPAEPLHSILHFFPHWFTPSLQKYAWQAPDIAFRPQVIYNQIAPRPILLNEGYFDLWASPWLSSSTLQDFARSRGESPESVSYPIRFPLNEMPSSPYINAHGPYKHAMHEDYWRVIGRFVRAHFS